MARIASDALITLVSETLSIAAAAGLRILEIYETDFSIEQKQDDSPLTLADMAAHNVICYGLARLSLDIPILSEESSNVPYSERKHWKQYWLVDPLDGTREFIKKNGEFTVNIALVDQNEPILGVIHVPVTGISYFATKTRGAYKCVPGEKPQPIHVRTTMPGQITLAGSRSHSNEKQEGFIRRLGKGTDIKAIGSSLKFCLVAEGLVDIYPRFGPTSEWDTAAAQCIVTEAGGMVTDMNFNPLNYNSRESLINPDFLVIADKSFDWKQYLSG